MNTQSKCDLASWCLMGVALVTILKAHLLAALLSGLLVHELIHTIAPLLRISGTSLHARKIMALLLLVFCVAGLVTAAVIGLMAASAHGPDSLVALMQKMAELIETSRSGFPQWVQAYLPDTAAELETTASDWLRSHAGSLKVAGENVGRGLVHVLIGIVIGSLTAFSSVALGHRDRPLVISLKRRATILGNAFRNLAVAQVRVSAINTLLTAIYLAVLLPLCGVHLPLVKTMILVTFIAGLMPLIGNLISNTVIVIVSLNESLGAAVGSLIFLISIHKLEYLVNAQIIGTQIRARAWELLLAMLAMEAVFGLPGLVAAPVFYSYVKDELSARGLV